MKPVLFYLLQVITASGILYGYYHFFLRNKKFHQYNRYYLLAAVVISMVIPFLRIPIYFEEKETNPFILQTLTAISSSSFEEGNITADATPVQQTVFTLNNILSFAYVLVGLVLFTRFLLALFKIARMVRIYPTERLDDIQFINTTDPATPFSFFRWLFWNKKIELNSDNGQQIFRHELFHIRQKHSWDIIFLEIISILIWINPFFYLIKREIKVIHEFLADKFAVEKNKEWNYAELLLLQVLGSPDTRLTNPFFHNQIKRRIAMLTTSQNPGYQYLRKIMILPLAALLIGLFAFTYKNKAAKEGVWSEEPIAIVVDAGKGGNDPETMNIGKEISEATIPLEILEGTVKYKPLKISTTTDRSHLISDTLPSVKKIITGDSVILKADSITFLPSKDKTKNNAPPLYVIDGVVLKEEIHISKIIPDKIETITVLKGTSATDKYGKDGTNGVIEIKTKKEIEAPAKKDTTLKEVIVIGYPVKSLTKNDEIAVAGHPVKEANHPKEIKAVGYDTAKPTRIKEVTVIGYPLKKQEKN